MATLEGITCTNDDPTTCAICSALIPKGLYTSTFMITFCCGKRICSSCSDSGAFIEDRGRCSLCHVSFEGNKTEYFRHLKKRAKKGAPWAQFLLGCCFTTETFTAQSDFEAVRWYRKAAAQGHPEACYRLGYNSLNGLGCDADLSEAQAYLEKAMLLDATLVDDTSNLLATIGGERINEGDYAKAKLILTPLAEAGSGDAQHNLGQIFFINDEVSTAERWAVSAALQGGQSVNSAFFALSCCRKLDKPGQSRYWLEIATKFEKEVDGMNSNERMDAMNSDRADLRKLRDSCGGCGATLDGKMRKICGQCKAYCYCGRECQKLHWNRKGKDGHRDDCMGVLDLKEKMKMMADEKNSSGE